MKVLVSWYGAFYGNGTIGDLLSVQSLTNHLYKCGHSIHCTSYKDFPDILQKSLIGRILVLVIMMLLFSFVARY